MLSNVEQCFAEQRVGRDCLFCNVKTATTVQIWDGLPDKQRRLIWTESVHKTGPTICLKWRWCISTVCNGKMLHTNTNTNTDTSTKQKPNTNTINWPQHLFEVTVMHNSELAGGWDISVQVLGQKNLIRSWQVQQVQQGQPGKSESVEKNIRALIWQFCKIWHLQIRVSRKYIPSTDLTVSYIFENIRARIWQFCNRCKSDTPAPRSPAARECLSPAGTNTDSSMQTQRQSQMQTQRQSQMQTQRQSQMQIQRQSQIHVHIRMWWTSLWSSKLASGLSEECRLRR